MLGVGTVRTIAGHDVHRLRLEVRVNHSTTVRLNQLYFPGWRLWLNGRVLPAEVVKGNVLPDGRLSVVLPPGTHELHAAYDGPPGWRARNAVIAALLLAFAGFVWRERRRSKRQALRALT